MISIIPKRGSLLAPPFQTKRTGNQLCCAVAIMGLLSPSIPVEPVLSMEVEFEYGYRVITPPWLDADISVLTEMTIEPEILAVLSPQLEVTGLLASDCVTSGLIDAGFETENLMEIVTDISPCLDAAISVNEQLNCGMSVQPSLHMVAERPVCNQE